MQENRELFFLIFFAGSAVLSYFLTFWIRRLAGHLHIHDLPDLSRKIHDAPRPKLGGLAIFFTFTFGALILAVVGGANELSFVKLAGIVVGGVIIVFGGVLDDKYDLPAWSQICFPIAAALLVVLSGSHISYFTNPLGGAVILDQYKIGSYPVFGSIFVFLWIMGLTYTTKFLDGMDGLVSGVSGIAGLAIFALSLSPEVNQFSTALLALIFAGAVFGFLPHNFHPAKIFLGEGGSTYTGFLIASLAVISGGKIATALLVLGIPALDAAWVIFKRLVFGASPFVGDKRHLHFQLLDIGLSQRQAVMLLYFFAAVFGSVAVFLQSYGKLIALLALSAVMVSAVLVIAILYRRRKHEQSG